MVTLRGIAYDLDGTITDTVKIHEQAWEYAARDLGIDLEPDFLVNQKGLTSEHAASMVCDTSDLASRLCEAKRVHASRLATAPVVHESFFETVEVLRDRGLELGICTSASKSFVDLVFATDERFSAFKDRVVFREMYVNGKPDPEPLRLMFSLMKLTDEDCLYVGDAYSDYVAANAAGCDFIYFCGQGGIDHRISQYTPRINQHSELLGYLA